MKMIIINAILVGFIVVMGAAIRVLGLRLQSYQEISDEWKRSFTAETMRANELQAQIYRLEGEAAELRAQRDSMLAMSRQAYGIATPEKHGGDYPTVTPGPSLAIYPN